MPRKINSYIKTDTGAIILYGDEKTQTAGMTFIPNGSNKEINIVCVACADENGKDSSHPDHAELKNIDVFCYENTCDENYTHKFRISTDEADESLIKPCQPDSQKL